MASMVVILETLPNLFVHPKLIDPSIQSSSNAFSYLFRALFGCGINGLLKTIPLLMMLRYFASAGIFCLTKTISSICRVHKVAVNMQIAKKLHQGELFCSVRRSLRNKSGKAAIFQVFPGAVKQLL